MKAAMVHRIGGGHDADVVASPEQISVETNVPVPSPAEGEVLLQVKAASVNPVDWKLMNGDFPGKEPGTGFGLDVCGTVAKLGEGVTSLQVGDVVYADVIMTNKAKGSGSWAEYCLCQAVAAHNIPKNVTPTEAASLSLVGLTAIQGLTRQGGIQKGSKVRWCGVEKMKWRFQFG